MAERTALDVMMQYRQSQLQQALGAMEVAMLPLRMEQERLKQGMMELELKSGTMAFDEQKMLQPERVEAQRNLYQMPREQLKSARTQNRFEPQLLGQQVKAGDLNLQRGMFNFGREQTVGAQTQDVQLDILRQQSRGAKTAADAGEFNLGLQQKYLPKRMETEGKMLDQQLFAQMVQNRVGELQASEFEATSGNRLQMSDMAVAQLSQQINQSANEEDRKRIAAIAQSLTYFRQNVNMKNLTPEQKSTMISTFFAANPEMALVIEKLGPQLDNPQDGIKWMFMEKPEHIAPFVYDFARRLTQLEPTQMKPTYDAEGNPTMMPATIRPQSRLDEALEEEERAKAEKARPRAENGPSSRAKVSVAGQDVEVDLKPDNFDYSYWGLDKTEGAQKRPQFEAEYGHVREIPYLPNKNDKAIKRMFENLPASSSNWLELKWEGGKHVLREKKIQAGPYSGYANKGTSPRSTAITKAQDVFWSTKTQKEVSAGEVEKLLSTLLELDALEGTKQTKESEAKQTRMIAGLIATKGIGTRGAQALLAYARERGISEADINMLVKNYLATQGE